MTSSTTAGCSQANKSVVVDSSRVVLKIHADGELSWDPSLTLEEALTRSLESLPGWQGLIRYIARKEGVKLPPPSPPQSKENSDA